MEYLKKKSITIDDSILKYIENGTEISEEDEKMHDFKLFPHHHNESWYFNFIDRPNNIFCISRFSFEMGLKRSRILFIIVIDGEANTYFKEIPLEKMPSNLEFDKRLQYYCIKPMTQWKLCFEDRKVKLDVTFDARFPVFNSATNEDLTETLEKYGVEILDVAAQMHYEQAMKVTGTLILKKQEETRQTNCFGHRDHSWGTRDWVNIDGWNWGAAQFADETIGFVRSDVLGKNPQFGFISSKQGNILIKSVEVSTKTRDDGKTPMASTFILTDQTGRQRMLNSQTIFSLHLPLPSEKGFTEIYEQIVIYTCEGKEGDGISEYLISTKK